jgi:hypothetical protein
MKSLDQVEARTPLAGSTSTVTIDTSGSYYLTGNVSVSTGNGISVTANGVTLDLNGFTISSSAATAAGTGINLNGSDITIRNGHIRGGVTFSAGAFSAGPGFQNGIFYGSARNIYVSGVSVSGVSQYGIYLPTVGSTIVVDHCTVRTSGSFGISARNVSSCSADQAGTTAINGYEVSDSTGSGVAGAIGFSGVIASNCFGLSDGRSERGQGA